MSERSSISLAEVLGENYYIDKLTSSEYSPAVGDTVTITLSVNDVFGDPANGQTRTVTCTGGSFVSVNGSSITSSDSVEVTTGSGGTVTLGLSVSVADNIIVSDGRCDCVVCSLSNSITNINTYTTHIDNENYTVKYNNYRVLIDVHMSSTTFPTTLTAFNDNLIPSDCRPAQPVVVFLQNVNAIVSVRENSKGVYRKSISGSAIGSGGCYCHIEYSRV